MNKLILILMAVIFTSCSSYYYTANNQPYTDVAVVEPLEEEDVISSQIYPVITFTNWNVYSNYWNNYFYSPYYITPSVAWSFNSPYNYTWSVSYWRPWNSWNNWYGWNSWNNYNYWGWNSWNNWYGYNNWYGWNSWNHHPYNWYGFNSWNHPYNNWYGWNGCGNNYFFNNTYITNNYGHGLHGGKIFSPVNTFGGSGFSNGKLANNYTSVPVNNQNGKLSDNSPVKPTSMNPADKYTSVRTNDIRNYQASNVQSVRENSTRPEVRSNEIRSYQTPSRENSYTPSRVESKPRVETPSRVENSNPVRNNSYTPSPRVETPSRVETYTRPERQNNYNSSPSRSDSPRNIYTPRQSSPSYSSPHRNSYSPRQNAPSYSSPQRNSYTPRQSSPSRSSFSQPRTSSPTRSSMPSSGSRGGRR